MRIAFGSKARVGKDIACAYLQQEYGGDVLHFSDSLYQIMHYAQDVCGFPRKKDVKFLQWIGTEWGRSQKDTVWIDNTLAKVPDDSNCFIADLRFPNEVKALKENGFICIKIMRTERTIDRNTKHESEVALDNFSDWDYVITNDGSLSEFYDQLDFLVEKLI